MASSDTPRRNNSASTTPTRKRSGNSNAATKSGSKTTTRKRTAPAAAAPVAPARQSLGNRDGAVGTAAKPSKQVADFVKAVKAKAKGRQVVLQDSVMPELLLKVDGVTGAYLHQRDGATDLTVRYRQLGLNLKNVGGSGPTFAQAADAMLKNMAGRPARATRTTRPATTPANDLQKQAAAAGKRSGGSRKSGNSGRARTTRTRRSRS